jgi:hypothetical protein
MKRFTSSTIVLVLFLCPSTVLSGELFGAPHKRDLELQKMQAFQVREEGRVKYFGGRILESREAGLVLHLRGSDYEMGYHHGILLRDIIREKVKRNLGRVEPNMDKVDAAKNFNSRLLKK